MSKKLAPVKRYSNGLPKFSELVPGRTLLQLGLAATLFVLWSDDEDGSNAGTMLLVGAALALAVLL